MKAKRISAAWPVLWSTGQGSPKRSRPPLIALGMCVLLVWCSHLWAEPVARWQLPEFPGSEIATLAGRVYVILQKQAHYLLGQVKPWNGDGRYKLLTESRSQEHWIRPNTGALQAFCFLYRFGPYDETVMGLRRDELLQQVIVPMIRYLTDTHVTGTRPTGDGKPWGDAWQSAHWAQMLGRGAWWVFDDLSEDLQTAVRRVVRHEAERIARTQPPFNLRGDTKAEENAWNAQILSVAWLLMPQDDRADKWIRQFQRWTMSAFLRPKDQSSPVLIDGRPVAEQFTGANIFDDFTLENHGFVHPDYMTTFSLSLGCATDFRMTGRTEPQALLWNVPGIYENLKWFILPDMGFLYPSGQDWTIFRQPAWITCHVLMFVYGRDPEAWDLLKQTVMVTEQMQNRSPQGAIYDPEQYFFPSTQTDIASALARAWLHLHFADPNVAGTYRPRWGVRHLEYGKILIHRTPQVVHALSYGAVVMGTITAHRPDRLTSPDQRSLIGQVILDGQNSPLPVKLASAEVDVQKKGFTAEFTVRHGNEVEAYWTMSSESDGQYRVAEKLIALRDCAIQEVATGLIGILNDKNWIFETGQRVIELEGETVSVGAHSGKMLEKDRVSSGHIDGTLVFHLSPPRTVRYRGAQGTERGRATDRLYLNVIPGVRHYRTGDVLEEWSATISPAAPKE